MKYPKAIEEVKGGIIIPQTSAQRPEFGEIIDIGEPTNETERQLAIYFSEKKKNGEKVCASFAAGTSLFLTNYDPAEWGWLKDFKIFRLTEIPATIEGA